MVGGVSVAATFTVYPFIRVPETAETQTGANVKTNYPPAEPSVPAGIVSTRETPKRALRGIVRSGRGPRRAQFLIGSAVLIILAVFTPITAALYDSTVRAMNFWSVLVVREAANLVGVVCGIAVLYALTHARGIDSSRIPGVLAMAFITTLASAAARQAAQIALDPNRTRIEPQLRFAEASSSLLIVGVLVAVLLLVAQRERLANTQTILLDEARRALQDDHESLRGRVFDHLHGTVTSELVVARVRLLDIARELPPGVEADGVLKVAAGLQRLHQLEIRRLAHVMVASGLDTSLHEALTQLAASSEGLCDVSVAIDAEFEVFDHASTGDSRAFLRLAIYRIVEECIANAIRHGQAKDIDVAITTRLTGRKRLVDVIVTNSGDLTAANGPEGVGLRVVRARAAAFNGSVDTSTREGRYVVAVHMEVPD